MTLPSNCMASQMNIAEQPDEEFDAWVRAVADKPDYPADEQAWAQLCVRLDKYCILLTIDRLRLN